MLKTFTLKNGITVRLERMSGSTWYVEAVNPATEEPYQMYSQTEYIITNVRYAIKAVTLVGKGYTSDQLYNLAVKYVARFSGDFLAKLLSAIHQVTSNDTLPHTQFRRDRKGCYYGVGALAEFADCLLDALGEPDLNGQDLLWELLD